MGHSLVVVAEADFVLQCNGSNREITKEYDGNKIAKENISKIGYISVSFNKEVGVYGESQK